MDGAGAHVSKSKPRQTSKGWSEGSGGERCKAASVAAAVLRRRRHGLLHEQLLFCLFCSDYIYDCILITSLCKPDGGTQLPCRVGLGFWFYAVASVVVLIK